MKECRFCNIRHIFEKYHYKGGNMGGGITLCLGAYYEFEYLAGVVIGKPRHEQKYSDGCNCVEIRRMACVDELPKNTESWLLGKTIWWLKKCTIVDRVISYSDLSVGHIGTIYKAANFKLIGKTAPSKHIFWKGKRYHPRSLTINRPYSYEMRKGLETGETKIVTG
ncbi:MAG: Mom family adenine methylcarbamoylation protein [Candidatus Scalindua sp.]